MKKRSLPIRTLFLTSLPLLCVLLASAWYWYSVIYPTPPDLSCGAIQQSVGGKLVQATPQAEDCFVHEFHLCQARTLAYSEQGVDTYTLYQLWPMLGMRDCQVQVKQEAHGLQQQTNYFTCTSLAKTAEGLLISHCNAQPSTILIPAA